MAKKENRPAVDPMAGLVYGQSKAEKEELRRQEELRWQKEQRKQEEGRFTQEKKAEQKLAKEEIKSEIGRGNLVNIYAEKKKKMPQTRTVRLQVVVTPAISERLNKLVENHEIKSRNDLINFLLESYFDMLDEAE